MNAKHTATPWRIGTNYKCRIIGNGKPIAYACMPDDELTENEEELANAKHIVHCVNSFDLLLTQLNDIISSKTHEEAINYAKKMVQQMQERC